MKKILTILIAIYVGSVFAQDIPPMPIYANKQETVKKVNSKNKVVNPKKEQKDIKTKKTFSLKKKNVKEADLNSSYGNVSASNLAR